MQTPPRPFSLPGLLGSIARTCLLVSALSFVWLFGAFTIRKHATTSALGIQPGLPGSAAGGASSTSAMFAPKEYNKVRRSRLR